MILVIILFLNGCSDTNNDKRTTENLTKADSLQINLIGQWGALGDNNCVWTIKPDSIFFCGTREAYAYEIVNGNFIIKRPELNIIWKNISVVTDTMFFKDDLLGLIMKAYRLKPQK